MAQAPRGFLWQMSSSTPWSLPPASRCAPPPWKTLTHQHPPVAQRGNSHPNQGLLQEYENKIDVLYIDLICVHQVQILSLKLSLLPFRLHVFLECMILIHFLFTLFDSNNVAIILFDLIVFGWKLQ